jgi:exonuclease SbcC
MSNFLLEELDITNFRSIRGHIHAPRDAKVVLIRTLQVSARKSMSPASTAPARITVTT